MMVSDNKAIQSMPARAYTYPVNLERAFLQLCFQLLSHYLGLLVASLASRPNPMQSNDQDTSG